MIVLPSFKGKTIPRPGLFRQGKTVINIPDEEKNSLFWLDVYRKLEESGLFQYPIEDTEEKINPYFGYYGLQWHPVSCKSGYFNIGIDIGSPSKTPIFPIHTGILEYSGFGLINGNYVVLSHPDVVTEDGFVLHSMYMHNKANIVNFSSYQKMLRQISLGNYPELKIPKDKAIAEVGDSGNPEGLYNHLHLQILFVHKKLPSVALNPASVLGIKSKNNRTSSLKTYKDFIQMYRKYKKNIHEWKIDKFWTSKIANL